MGVDLEKVELTAAAMAQERYVESGRKDRLFEDPLAGELVAAVLESSDDPALAWLRDGLRLGDVVPQMGDYVAFRTRYIDDQIRDACSAEGPRQVVFVAAGLDTRAFRLPWLPDTQLYEMDFPTITQFKQRVVDASKHRPGVARHPLGVDLRDGWIDVLRENGFRPQEPTLWIAEGLLMYLTEQANELLMRNIADLSAPGSHLIIDHAYPSIEQNRGFSAGRDNLEANGSGLQSHIADPQSWLAAHGWAAHVAKPEELASSYKRPLPPVIDPQRPDAPVFWFASAQR